MTIIGDNYGEIDTETGECTTISDIEREYFSQQKTKKMFPYLWSAGVISELTAEQIRVVKTKHCAICGKIGTEDEPLTHEHLSGGVKNYIHGLCAQNYVLNAEAVKCKYATPIAEPKNEMMKKTLQITLPAFDAEELKSVIEEWAEEYGIEQMNVEVL